MHVVVDKWKENVEQQRTFFTVLAHDKGFHATLEHDVWYSISLKDILYYKVCGAVRTRVCMSTAVNRRSGDD